MEGPIRVPSISRRGSSESILSNLSEAESDTSSLAYQPISLTGAQSRNIGSGCDDLLHLLPAELNPSYTEDDAVSDSSSEGRTPQDFGRRSLPIDVGRALYACLTSKRGQANLACSAYIPPTFRNPTQDHLLSFPQVRCRLFRAELVRLVTG